MTLSDFIEDKEFRIGVKRVCTIMSAQFFDVLDGDEHILRVAFRGENGSGMYRSELHSLREYKGV